MNVQKTLAIAAAMLITAAGMTGIAHYDNAAAASLQHAVQSAPAIETLPAVNVYPEPAALRTPRHEQAGATPATLQMPYYSFASDAAGA